MPPLRILDCHLPEKCTRNCKCWRPHCDGIPESRAVHGVHSWERQQPGNEGRPEGPFPLLPLETRVPFPTGEGTTKTGRRESTEGSRGEGRTRFCSPKPKPKGPAEANVTGRSAAEGLQSRAEGAGWDTLAQPWGHLDQALPFVLTEVCKAGDYFLIAENSKGFS